MEPCLLVCLLLVVRLLVEVHDEVLVGEFIDGFLLFYTLHDWVAFHELVH